MDEQSRGGIKMKAVFKITINTYTLGQPTREYVKTIHIGQHEDELMIVPIVNLELTGIEHKAMSSTFDIMQHIVDVINLIHPSWEAKVV